MMSYSVGTAVPRVASQIPSSPRSVEATEENSTATMTVNLHSYLKLKVLNNKDVIFKLVKVMSDLDGLVA